MTRIEMDGRTGNMSAFIGERCVAEARRSSRIGYMRMAIYEVRDLWRGGDSVSAIGPSSAKTALRRIGYEFVKSQPKA
jgi:hypothetical protein